MSEQGWSGLFHDAFRRSLNPMVLTDAQRVVVDVNNAFVRLLSRRRDTLVGRSLFDLVQAPVATAEEWREVLLQDEVTGEANLLCADNSSVRVQFAAYPEVVTGRRLVLFVALSVSRWGRHFRRSGDAKGNPAELSDRELDVIRLIARGASGPEIAEQLSISHNTVRSHAKNAMERVGARSRAHLVAKVLGHGIGFENKPR